MNPIEIKSDLFNKIYTFYNMHNNLDTFEHSLKVAHISVELAKKYELDTYKCYLSGLLHDISTYLTPNEMRNYAEEHKWLINQVENEFQNLLHQKISSNMSLELFDINDNQILDSIKCHTTLKGSPSMYDMILFISDKLSWGKDTIFYEDVIQELNRTLEHACLSYINIALEYKLISKPHPDLLAAKEYLEKNNLT